MITIRRTLALAVLPSLLASCSGLGSCEPGSCTGDERISGEVRTRLDAQPALRGDDVGIHTLDHVVYLTGLVDTDLERREAVSAAQQGSDVAQVIDEIGVLGNK